MRPKPLPLHVCLEINHESECNSAPILTRRRDVIGSPPLSSPNGTVRVSMEAERAPPSFSTSSYSPRSTRRLPQPFPLALENLSKTEHEHESSHGDRARLRSHHCAVPTGLEFALNPDVDSEGDSGFNTGNADVCPFCDEPWPDQPSAKLLALKATAMAHAFPSPRLENPQGLSAHSFTFFIQLCTQHRNETTVIPQGLKQGWPDKLDFDELPRRLQLIRTQLAAIVHDPTGSHFYKEVMGELRTLGSRFASSIQGQYFTFDKRRPGYYGERGYVMITGVLGDLFPNIVAELYRGGFDKYLEPDVFISQVLVPEAARFLIKDDLTVSDEDALDVLVNSQAFGMALHPELGTNDSS